MPLSRYFLPHYGPPARPTPTAGGRLIGLVADWRERFGCPAPTSYLCNELGLSTADLGTLVNRLAVEGLVAWTGIATPWGDKDVTDRFGAEYPGPAR